MKKVMILSAAFLAFTAMPVLADGHGGKGHKGAKMFEKHDTNSDGTISKDEFLAHATERFENMDADGDGRVSKEEAKAAGDAKRAKMKDKMKARKAKKSSE